jgi:DNA-binding CsgD family transcriptional regulator
MLVARRHLDLLVALASLEGLAAEMLVPNLASESSRVPWDVVVRATQVLVEAAGGADALADSATTLLPGPELALLAQGEASVGGVLAFVVTQLLPGDFPLMHWEFTCREPGAIDAAVTLRGGYASCPACFSLFGALFQTVPRLFGLPDALVRTTLTARGAAYRVEYAEPSRLANLAQLAPPTPDGAPIDAATGLRHLLDDGHEQRRARDQTMAALARIAERLTTSCTSANTDPATAIVATLFEQLDLAHVCLWGSTAPGRPARRLAAAGPRADVPGRAIPLVAAGVRVGHLEIPRDSAHTEWLEAAAPFLAVELSRDAPTTVEVAPRHQLKARTWQLTPRQSAVLERLVAGAANKEIAADLGCAVTTVEEHLTAIYRKAGVSGRYPLLALLLSS